MVDMTIPEEQVVTGTIEDAIDKLKQRFPKDVSDDDRQGYSGVIISSDKLQEAARYIKDELGFDYLSNLALFPISFYFFLVAKANAADCFSTSAEAGAASRSLLAA